MKLAKDLVVIGASAVLTALVAGPFVVPGPASAGPEESALLRVFLEPGPVDASGVGLTMDFVPDTCRPGEKLAATLHAVNRKDGAEERRVKVLMHVTPRTFPMARMIPMPKLAWTRELTLSLAKGESRNIAIHPEIPIQEGEIVTFSIEADGRTAPIARYAAATPAASVNLLPFVPKEAS